MRERVSLHERDCGGGGRRVLRAGGRDVFVHVRARARAVVSDGGETAALSLLN